MIDSTRDIQKLSREMDIPLNATIELLTECNLRCIHCYIPNHSEKGLEDYQLFSLFRELREMHTLYLNLTGGEIFLKKNIMGLLEEARNMGFSVSLLSNATQIDERIIRRLAELRISSFGTTLFSLDSSIHDAITRVSGSLEKALLNIALLKEYNIKVEIKTPIMRQNLLHYGRIEHFCDENGFLFNPTPTITSKNDGDNSVKKSCVDDEQMDAIADMILRRTSETAEKILKTDKEDKSLCPNTKNSVFIDAYGDVFPCINFRYKIGDVFSADLKNIWLGLERRYLLSLDKNMLTHCRSCNLQQECYPCPGLALLEDGSMFACSSSARKMAEAEHRNKKKGG